MIIPDLTPRMPELKRPLSPGSADQNALVLAKKSKNELVASNAGGGQVVQSVRNSLIEIKVS